MKSILVCFLFWCQVVEAAWTFHGAKDNWLGVVFYGVDPVTDNPTEYVNNWDWTYDQLYPSTPDSGFWTFDYVTEVYTPPSGVWSEIWTFSPPNGVALYSIDLSGPANDYLGDVYWLHPVINEGEYWVDFDSGGQGRISIIQLADFGKWAWNGSINPSWTAAKKGFAKGHNKQPLPSPK